MYKSLYFISSSKTSSSRMVTACLWGPELPATSWKGPGERLGAVAEEAQGGRGGSTVRQETGRDEGAPLPSPRWGASSGSWDIPGRLPRDPFPGPGTRVQRQVRAAGFSQPGTGPAALGPALALLQGAERGSRQRGEGRRGRPPGTSGDSGVGSLSSGHEDAWSDGAHPGTETLMRERGPAGPRHRRASGGDGGTRQGEPLPRACLCTRSAERGARSSRC